MSKSSVEGLYVRAVHREDRGLRCPQCRSHPGALLCQGQVEATDNTQLRHEKPSKRYPRGLKGSLLVRAFDGSGTVRVSSYCIGPVRFFDTAAEMSAHGS